MRSPFLSGFDLQSKRNAVLVAAWCRKDFADFVKGRERVSHSTGLKTGVTAKS
jgi:hypothetical protein